MCWSIERWGEIEDLKQQLEANVRNIERAKDKEAVRELLDSLPERRAAEISART